MPKINVAIISLNLFAIKGLKELIDIMDFDVDLIGLITIESVCDASELNKMALVHSVDILIFAECNHDTVGMSWYKCISDLRHEYPKMKIILGSCVPFSNIYRFRGLIDVFVFLGEPLSTLRFEMKRMVKRMVNASGDEYSSNKKKSGLSGLEWMVLKELKTGARIPQNSNHVNIPYRKVSALKNNEI